MLKAAYFNIGMVKISGILRIFQDILNYILKKM